MTLIWQVPLIGVGILVVAIIANGLAMAVGWTTWYGFIGAIQEEGMLAALRSAGLPSLLFLFVLYPAILGLTGYWLTRWLT
jgi:hypothetical protein